MTPNFAYRYSTDFIQFVGLFWVSSSCVSVMILGGLCFSCSMFCLLFYVEEGPVPAHSACLSNIPFCGLVLDLRYTFLLFYTLPHHPQLR